MAIVDRKGNWEIARYGNNKNGFAFWVYDLPYKTTLLKFNTYKEAKQYLDSITS